jgi:hypothetical protein
VQGVWRATRDGFDSVKGGVRGRVCGIEGGWRRTDIKSTAGFVGDLDENLGPGDDALSRLSGIISFEDFSPRPVADFVTGDFSQSSNPEDRLRFSPRFFSCFDLRNRAASWTSPLVSTSASNRSAWSYGIELVGKRLDNRARRVSVSSCVSMRAFYFRTPSKGIPVID